MDSGNESFFSPHVGHMTKMATTHIYGKNPLKFFFFRTKGPMALGLGRQHWGHKPNKVEKKITLGCPSRFFYGKVNILHTPIR